MTDTTRLSLPRPTGSDLISGGDDAITEIANTLDDAAIYGSGVIASRPAAATLAGKFYYATDTGALFLSIGSAWVEIATGAPVPVGASLDYAGATDPADTRFLLEDGRAISRATYPAYAQLQADAGYPYGNGNGTTTVNIPDSRGRGTVAPDDMGTAAGAAGRMASNKTLGAAGGAETRTLLTANLPAHDHPVGTLATTSAGSHDHGPGTLATASGGAHTHAVGTLAIGGSGTLTTGATNGNTSDVSGDHLHGIKYTTAAGGSGGAAAEFVTTIGSGSGFGATDGENIGHVHAIPNHTHTVASHTHALTGATASDGAHTHSLSGSVATNGAHTHPITGTVGSTGSGTAFNQMHPYVVKNKIIRVL